MEKRWRFSRVPTPAFSINKKQVKMADTIRGPVTNVVDGNTFDMKITHTGKDNQTKYNNKERIRIADIDEPELNTPAERDPKKNLKGNSKEKKCVVMFRRVIPTRESLQK